MRCKKVTPLPSAPVEISKHTCVHSTAQSSQEIVRRLIPESDCLGNQTASFIPRLPPQSSALAVLAVNR